jgi:peroxiredoxin
MKNFSKLAVILVLVMGLFSCNEEQSSQPDQDKQSEKKLAAPEKQYQAEFLDGKDFDSHDYRGNKIVFGFFSYTHKDAAHLLKTLDKLKEYESKFNFKVFGVAINPGKAKEVQAFLDKNKITLPTIIEGSNLDIAMELGVENEVTFLGVDNQHELSFGVKKYVFAGMDDGETVALDYLKESLNIKVYHSTEPRLGIYPPAPDFTAKTMDGKTIKMSKLKGKAVLLVFFSPKCPHCQKELKFLRDDFYPAYKDKGFEVIAVSVLALEGEALKLYNSFKFTWPIIDSSDGKIRKLYSKARSVPDNFWINKKGQIQYHTGGFSSHKKDLYHMQMKQMLGLPNPPKLSQHKFSGVDTCRVCHEEQYVTWSVTPHAQAWETLEIKGETFNPECVGCHSVGFNEPKGFKAFTDQKSGKKVVQVPPSFQDVQCENCHGLGGPHVQTTDVMARDTLEETCLKCHTAKFSLHFDFDKRVEKVNHSNKKAIMKLGAKDRLKLLEKVAKKPEDLFDTSIKYVGSAKCSTCHEDISDSWKTSKHGTAFGTLKKVHEDGNNDCLQCHTVGFGESGGYQEHVGNKDFESVGCESCHGPGEKHAESKLKEDIRGLGDDCPFCVIEQICLSCHDPKNAPDFNIHQGLEKIKGHK